MQMQYTGSLGTTRRPSPYQGRRTTPEQPTMTPGVESRGGNELESERQRPWRRTSCSCSDLGATCHLPLSETKRGTHSITRHRDYQ